MTLSFLFWARPRPVSSCKRHDRRTGLAKGYFACRFARPASSADLKGALSSLRGFSSRLSTDLSVADVRSDFTANLRNVLKSGAANLTLADPNEEGANLLALQTRTSLASASLSLTQRAESSILRLFS